MIMELTTQVKIYNKEQGDYTTESEIEIVLFGRKSAVAIKKIQTKIYKSFSSVSGSGEAKKETSGNDETITANEILVMIDLGGISDTVFEEVLKIVQTYGKIADSKITDEIMEQLSVEDLDRLYEKVVTDFLAGQIIQRLTSTKS